MGNLNLITCLCGRVCRVKEVGTGKVLLLNGEKEGRGSERKEGLVDCLETVIDCSKRLLSLMFYLPFQNFT